MHELLPNASDIRISQKTGRVNAKALDSIDQLVLFLPKRPQPEVWRAIPQGSRLKSAMGKRHSGDIPVLQTRLSNQRQTQVVAASVSADTSTFQLLTISRKLIASTTGEKAGTLGIYVVGFAADQQQAIYQARFMRYMENRELTPPSDRKVWCFLGDGEMDEPESMGAITMPVREGLDNLVFVVNCNLQRLDGPVRGNGKIIQELEAAFGGAGWNVIKVVWGGR